MHEYAPARQNYLTTTDTTHCCAPQHETCTNRRAPTIFCSTYNPPTNWALGIFSMWIIIAECSNRSRLSRHVRFKMMCQKRQSPLKGACSWPNLDKLCYDHGYTAPSCSTDVTCTVRRARRVTRILVHVGRRILSESLLNPCQLDKLSKSACTMGIFNEDIKQANLASDAYFLGQRWFHCTANQDSKTCYV